MTREELIESLRILKEQARDYGNNTFIQIISIDSFNSVINSVIKALEQEPVIDKIRAEIETKYGQCDICEYFEDYDYEENDISEYRPIGDIADILQMIDKYKAESESQESEGEK